MRLRILVLLLFILPLCGCSNQASEEDIAARPDGRLFHSILKAVENGDVEEVRKHVVPILAQRPDFQSHISKAVGIARGFLTEKRLRYSRFLNYKDTFSARDGKSSELNALFLFEPEKKNGFIVTLVCKYEDDVPYVLDLKLQDVYNVQESEPSAEVTKYVLLSNVVTFHPVASAFAVLSLLVALSALWVSVFAQGVPKRWIWFALSTFGVCTFYIPANETGVGFDVAQIASPIFGLSETWRIKLGITLGGQGHLPPAAGMFFSLPIGAIITLLKWDDFRRARINNQKQL